MSPDEKTLYIADEPRGLVQRYTVNADGSTTAGAKFVDTAPNPDGMAIDDAGNVYVATQAGIEVFTLDGLRLGAILVPEQPTNCGFGGAERRTLYITARTSLYEVRLNVPGRP